MENEPVSKLSSMLSKAGAVSVIVVIALAIAYLAPLSVLSRIKDHAGVHRYLTSSISITSTFKESGFPARVGIVRSSVTFHHFKNPVLDNLYRPVLNAAGQNSQSWSGKTAKFILGIR